MRIEEDETKTETPNIEDTDQQIETDIEEEIETEAADKGENTSDDDAEDDTKPKPKADAEDDDEEEDWSVTIGEDEPEDEEEDADDKPKDKGENQTFREVRKKLREAQRENKRLRRQSETKTAEAQLPALGEKPTLQEFGYDEEKYEAELLAYSERKRQHDAKREEIKTRNANAQKRHEGRLAKYNTRREEITADAPDFEDAEETVIATFDDTKQAILVTATTDPAVMVLALGQRPKMLEKLNAIEDPIEFAATLARMEGSLKVKGSKSKRAAPERRVKRTSAKTGGVGDTKLEQLRAEANRTGDMTKVMAYKRDLKRQANRKK